MPTVYVVNKSGHDFSSAKTFGTLVYLSSGEIDVYNVNRMYVHFAEVLRDSMPSDYILITGMSVMSSVASTIMARKHGRVNWLLHHAGSGKYKARTIVLSSDLIGDVV